jgi:protein SCO1/2
VSTKALYAMMLALLLPLISYFIVKQYSDSAVVMPQHYFPDSVINVVRNGKQKTDTTWHRIPDFKLTNQSGQKISLGDIMKINGNDTINKIIVADFFFTRCPNICPLMTSNMKRLQESITNAQRVGDKSPDFIQFLSFSIDPERDSVPRLKAWADRFQINPDQWWLLTGDKKTIYDLCINDIKLGLMDGENVDTNFIHSDRFVLIDHNRNVRGYYNGLDTVSLARLSRDIILLNLEKDPKEKSFFAGKLQLIAVVFLIAIAGVAIFFYLFRKKTK